MRRPVLVAKADSMVWTLSLMEALLLILAGPGFPPPLVSSLARITGVKLVLRGGIRQPCYTNAQTSHVCRENWKDRKKD